MTESKYAKYIVTDLQTPTFSPGFAERYATHATRVLWMGENVVPESFQMNVSWFWAPTNSQQIPGCHTHNVDEIIGFFSGDPDNPYELGAELEFWLEDEKFMITKSCLIFAPAGMKHTPFVFHRVDRPVFHFSVVTSGAYKQEKFPAAADFKTFNI